MTNLTGISINNDQFVIKNNGDMSIIGRIKGN